jgi:V/A-type H+-transporting ATPase subunit A
MLSVVLDYNRKGHQALKQGASLNALLTLPVRDKIARAKYIEEKDLIEFDQIEKELSEQMAQLTQEEGR